MKIIHVAFSDSGGGAANAMLRLHRGLLAHGVESSVMVRRKKTADPSVVGPEGLFRHSLARLRAPLGHWIMRSQTSANSSLHSGNWLPSNWASQLNSSDAEVVNLHWLGVETMSIEDVGRIRKPVIWTLHDMWAFSGTEHLNEDTQGARWRLGYVSANRAPSDRGPDLDRIAWTRKLKAWRRPIPLVAPSRWLAGCAANSMLLGNWPASVIPNVLETGIFRPLDREQCRTALGLPTDRHIVLFGAIGATQDANKGLDLLQQALSCLAGRLAPESVICAIFGESQPAHAPTLAFATTWLGRIDSDETLAAIYNAADLVILPSRQENLPQIATEAHACGIPVVAFDVAGVPDVVLHRITGYLAQPFSPEDLANGILWILEDRARRHEMSCCARERALNHWRPEVVVPQYVAAYRQLLTRHPVSA